MTTYSIKVTKGKYQLSLTTTDRDMIVDEFEKWVQKVSAYVHKSKEHESVAHSAFRPNSEREHIDKKIEEQLKQVSASEQKRQESKDETRETIDALYSQPQQEKPALHQEEARPTIQTENENVQNVFDTILDRSMQTPQSELSFKPNPSIKKDNAFLNYISGRKVERKIDYLLMTAYYFTQYEQKPRFTLKQLNAKLMQNIAIILDHSVIQEAINREYIECLPDLTGVVGTSEYRLTAYGEKTLLEEG